MCLATNSKNDPTNTSKIRARAIKELRRRRDSVSDEIAAFVESLGRFARRQIVEDGRVVNRVIYKYELDPTINTDEVIMSIIRKWFSADTDFVNRYFFDEFITAAYTQGRAIEVARLSALVGGVDAMTQQQVELLMQTPAYQARLNILASRAFENMVYFTGEAGAPLRYLLTEAMAEGKGIRTIVARMKQEWDKQATYRLERIARSEIANAHRSARKDADTDARDRLGLQIKQQWISQLAPTTRPSHAEQHLKLFEIEEVSEKYAEIGSVNCLCLQQAVVITQDGEILGERKETPADKAAVAFIMTKG